ncbi:MAG: peptidase M15 [Gammaproteobacteria bacterium]|nr:peptidase M15 [Gammaproteobacteria bacterium]
MSVSKLEEFGRMRLSPSFFMRDFLYSEISQVESIPNIPDDFELALQAGRGLCENVLEPLQEKLGKISVRSGYRSRTINRIGNEKRYNCASNERNRTRHIWDLTDDTGHYGATACVVVNSFVDYYEKTGDWPALGWWIADQMRHFRDVMFFKQLAAFNINWYSGPVSERTVSSQVPNPETGKKGTLSKSSVVEISQDHETYYVDWLKSVNGQ